MFTDKIVFDVPDSFQAGVAHTAMGSIGICFFHGNRFCSADLSIRQAEHVRDALIELIALDKAGEMHAEPKPTDVHIDMTGHDFDT